MTSQKQLEHARVPRKSHTHTKVAPTASKMVTEESSVLKGQPLYPIKHASQIFTDSSKEGWGAHLSEHTARGTW